MRILPIAALLSLPLLAQAQDTAAGRWKTIDDATGKVKSIVEIQQARDGTYVGRVADILDTRNGSDPVCTACKGAQHGKPIKGLTILWGLKPAGNGKWSGGTVLDPENGKTYKAKLELLDGGRKLGMSGCIAFLCRQQVWVRQ
jgi:uncharacterized protein (DUF2147 family)